MDARRAWGEPGCDFGRASRRSTTTTTTAAFAGVVLAAPTFRTIRMPSKERDWR